MTTFSAREFNQQVSRARKAAEHEPVFITERGQPRHVLLSIETYQALTKQGRPITELLGMAQDVDADFPRQQDSVRAADLD